MVRMKCILELISLNKSVGIVILYHKNKLLRSTPTGKKFQLSMSYRVGLHQSDALACSG